MRTLVVALVLLIALPSIAQRKFRLKKGEYDSKRIYNIPNHYLEITKLKNKNSTTYGLVVDGITRILDPEYIEIKQVLNFLKPDTTKRSGNFMGKVFYAKHLKEDMSKLVIVPFTIDKSNLNDIEHITTDFTHAEFIPSLTSSLDKSTTLFLGVKDDEVDGKTITTGYLLNRDMDVVNIIPNIIPLDGFLRYEEGVKRLNEMRQAKYSFISDDNIFLKAKVPEGEVYIILNQKGTNIAPPIKTLHTFSRRLQKSNNNDIVKKKYYAVLIDDKDKLYLPFKNGELEPITEEHLIGYLPLAGGKIAQSKIYDQSYWNRYKANNQPKLAMKAVANIPGWIKVYDNNGKRSFGWASIDRLYETGPIWRASSMGVDNDYNNVTVGINKLVYAQGLDGSWRVYNAFGLELKPHFTETYATKAEASEAIYNYVTNQRNKELAAEAKAYREMKAERERLETLARKEKDRRWNQFKSAYDALPASNTDIRERGIVKSYAFASGPDAIYLYCTKFNDCTFEDVSMAYSLNSKSGYSRKLYYLYNRFYEEREAEKNNMAPSQANQSFINAIYNYRGTGSNGNKSVRDFHKKWDTYHKNLRDYGYGQNTRKWATPKTVR